MKNLPRARKRTTSSADVPQLPTTANQLPAAKPPPSEADMSFIEHLEELRWHLVRALFAIGIFMVVAFIAKGFVFEQLIYGPSKPEFPTYVGLCKLSNALYLGKALCLQPKNFETQNLIMAGQFLIHLKVAAILGFIVAFPYVLWEMWRFVSPGLLENELKYTRLVVFTGSTLFFSGVLFGYYILSPFTINFFVNYSVADSVVNQFTIQSYIGTIANLVLAAGLMFQLPLIVYFLAKVGIVTPAILRTYRKQAFIIILFLAAVVTPADVASQILVAVPVYLLYELSIYVAKVVYNKNQQLQTT